MSKGMSEVLTVRQFLKKLRKYRKHPWYLNSHGGIKHKKQRYPHQDFLYVLDRLMNRGDPDGSPSGMGYCAHHGKRLGITAGLAHCVLMASMSTEYTLDSQDYRKRTSLSHSKLNKLIQFRRLLLETLELEEALPF